MAVLVWSVNFADTWLMLLWAEVKDDQRLQWAAKKAIKRVAVGDW